MSAGDPRTWRQHLAEKLPGLLLVGFAFAAACYPISDTDIWWHLTAARQLVAERSFLRSDPFSTLSLDQPWYNLHWLFQLLVYGAYQLDGLRGIVVGKALTFAAAAWLLLRAIEVTTGTKPRSLNVAMLALLILAGRHLALERPVVLSLLFLCLLLLLVERFAAEPRRWILWALPLLQLVWSNCQPLFMLGPAVVGIFLLGELLAGMAVRHQVPGLVRRLAPRAGAWLALALVGMLVACLVTPYGWHGLAIPLRLLHRIDPTTAMLFSSEVTENIPTWVIGRSQGTLFWPFTLVSMAAFGCLLVPWRQVQPARFLLLVTFWLLALLANRNVLLFYFVAGQVALVQLHAAARTRWPEGPPALLQSLRNPLTAVVVVVGLSVSLGRSIRADVALDQPAPFRVPLAAAEQLARLPCAKRLFNSVRFGGYLAWRLYPEHRPFIDGRLVLSSAEQFERYLQVVDAPDQFDDYDRGWDFDAVVLPVAQPDRYQRLIQHLAGSTAWQLVFTDGSEVLFTKVGRCAVPTLDLDREPTVAAIAAELAQRHGAHPRVHEQALINLATLLNMLDRPQRAAALLAPVTSPDGQAMRCRSLYLGGEVEPARQLALTLLEQRPDDVNSHNLLALIARDRGDLASAVQHAQRALEIDRYSAEARTILQTIGADPAAPE